jgi:hypothetical protein
MHHCTCIVRTAANTGLNKEHQFTVFEVHFLQVWYLWQMQQTVFRPTSIPRLTSHHTRPFCCNVGLVHCTCVSHMMLMLEACCNVGLAHCTCVSHMMLMLEALLQELGWVTGRASRAAAQGANLHRALRRHWNTRKYDAWKLTFSTCRTISPQN